jgi:ABC-type nickel/cobalt efflux system permease component RcnA
MRRIQLPDCFEARYVVGRSLFLVPVLTFLLFVFWRVHSSWFWLFEIKYVIFVGIGVWMTIDKVESERNSVEVLVDSFEMHNFPTDGILYLNRRRTHCRCNHGPRQNGLAMDRRCVRSLRSNVAWPCAALAGLLPLA